MNTADENPPASYSASYSAHTLRRCFVAAGSAGVVRAPMGDTHGRLLGASRRVSLPTKIAAREHLPLRLSVAHSAIDHPPLGHLLFSSYRGGDSPTEGVIFRILDKLSVERGGRPDSLCCQDLGSYYEI
jgi:hypothetical protein